MILIPVSNSQHEAGRKFDTGTTIISTARLLLYPSPPADRGRPAGCQGNDPQDQAGQLSPVAAAC